MIEVRHLTKIYKGKGGVETRALDDVSVKFGDTGLVFILGKSGCGKSTFLNIVGGLDAPTDGEVIVNGKSSKDFTEADFDAYRNTSVGFVFQEYNVLEEFSVEDNVAIALELQKEKDVKGRVDEILREVELEDLAKRKPNTLSGGQKQRIAIARALVKDPQIIMADEPTGALDSGTGWQVLDTLRKLSKTRLVIVVSHDRDFAEQFGDRIIELSDGRIISDVTKVREETEEFRGNIRQIGPNILSVKGGSTLTEENLRDIQAFVSAGAGDIIITNGETEVESFKKANGINDDYAVESFMDTGETPAGLALDKMEPSAETKFIRSRLPMGKAIKMGASSLGIKRVRLAFTILLSVIAFVFFGFLSCLMTYNIADVASKSFAKAEDQYLNLTKYYQYTTTTYNYLDDTVDSEDYSRHTYFNEADAEAMGVEDAMFAITDSSYIYNASFSSNELYYKLQLNKAVYAPEGTSVRTLLYGSYPTEDNEACISSFLAESIIRSKFSDTDDIDSYVGSYKEEEDWGTVSFGSSIEDVIGHHIVTGSDTYFTVTGIFDAGEIPSRYSGLDEMAKTDSTAIYSDLYYEFSQYLADSMDENFLVTRSYIEQQSKAYSAMPSVSAFDVSQYNYYIGAAPADGEELDESWREYTMNFAVYGEDSAETVFIDGAERTSLADDEAVVPLVWLMDKVYDDFKNSVYDSLNGDEYSGAVVEFVYGNFQSEDEVTYNVYRAMQGLISGSYDYSVLAAGEEGSGEKANYTYKSHRVTDDERPGMYEMVNEYLEENPVTIALCEGQPNIKSSIGTLKVAGYYTGQEMSSIGLYLSEGMMDNIRIRSRTEITLNYSLPDDADFYYIIVPIQHKTSSWLKPIMKQLEKADESTGVIYSMSNELYSTIEQIDEVMDLLIIIFLIAGIVFAVFAALLMFNFISVSIAGKQKEIGILRAVGAKGGDVFKIFFSEAAIIALICLALALILTGVAVWGVNLYIQAEFLIHVTLIVFSGWCVLMMLAIAVIVAFLGTFFPVYFASKKKPVESIRSL
ncbi:MAG: ATP-binding cassette domain-containing protein [Clostridia bacterium]|nr:ATP-binding cassette domain-containing protein [Clostridia bacterium]